MSADFNEIRLTRYFYYLRATRNFQNIIEVITIEEGQLIPHINPRRLADTVSIKLRFRSSTTPLRYLARRLRS